MIRAFAVILALVFVPVARAEPLTYSVLHDGMIASAPAAKPQLPTIGSGRYRYRFTLRDPHTGLAWPRRAYALSLTLGVHRVLPFVTDPKGVYQGITDDAGKTSIFLLPFRVADQQWDFRERFGDGPYGETFKLVTTNPEQPLADMPYAITICSKPAQTFYGYSHIDGRTGFTASPRAEQLKIRGGVIPTDDTSDVCGETKALAPVEKDATVLPPEFPAKARIQAILYEGDTALKAHDYVKAHAHFAQADAIFRDHSAELQNPSSLMGHAEIRYYAALATGGGRLGDPCPELEEARQLAQTARDRSNAADEADMLVIVNTFLGDVDRQAALYKCAAAVGRGVQQSLVGHYYLSGIREVGSELLLKPGARFEWMLAYGSMDQSASGTWRVDGTMLILSTDRPDTRAPLAVLGPFIPWDVDAENAMRRRTLEVAQAAVAARCPFLAIADSVASTPRAYLDDAEREAAKAAASKEIAPVKARERASRAQVEIDAAAAMSATVDKSAVMAKANTALAAWQTDDADLYDVYDRAGLQRPARATPRLPAACIMPAFVDADSDDQPHWASGLGVQVRFADEDLPAAAMDVTFQFRNAANIEVESDRNGYAFVPAGNASTWTRVSLAILTQGGIKTVTLPVSLPKPTGIQAILLNAKALAASPFETMRLTISGSDLAPEGRLARGKYSRQ